MMNKKGDERIYTFYWFLMFVVVSIVIVGGVLLFFSRPLDIREVEGKILRDRIINCLVKNGALDEELLGKIDEKNFGSLCSLIFEDKSRPAYETENQFYIEIKVPLKNKIFEFGRKGIEPYCGQKKQTNAPLCVQDNLAVLDNGNLVNLNIKIVIDKVEQNAV
jgi:hypothetical protein